MVGFPTPPMQAKERQIYRTYADKKDFIYLAGMYSGANQGFHGYVGGLLFIQWTLGGTQIKIRNYASQAYPTGPNTDGVFDFDYSSIRSIQAQIYSDDISDPTKQELGVEVFVDTMGTDAIKLFFFNVVAGVSVPHVLTPTEAVHVEIYIKKNNLLGEAII